MSAIQAPASPPPTPATDAASRSALTALYRAALGHGPQERYLRRFAQFDAAGRTAPGWNWAASLSTLGWAALRHLWVPALLYVAVLEGLALLALGPGRWLLPQAAQRPALLAIAALAWLLPGLYGDALLHTEIRKRIVTALSQTQSVAEACTFLGQRSRTPKRLQGLVLVHTAMAVFLGAVAVLYLVQSQRPADAAAVAPSAHHTAAGAPGPELTVQEALAQATSAAEPAGTSAALLPITESLPVPAPIPEPAPLSAAPAPAALPAPTPAPATTPAAAAPSASSERTATPLGAAPISPGKDTPKPATPSPSKRNMATAAPPPDAAIPSQKTAAPVPGRQAGYYLNAGLFAEEANARKVQAQLLNANLPAFRQTLQTAQGQRIRVRVGPFATQQQAQAQSATLRGMGLEAVVFRQ